MPEADLKNYRDASEGFPLVPEGEYNCTVDGIEELTSKKGNEMWKVTLGIFEGEQEGAKIIDYLTWTPGAMPRIVNFFKALGRNVAEDGTVTYIPMMALDKKVKVAVHVEKREWDGEERESTKVDFAGYGHIDGGQIREGQLPEKQDDVGEVPF